MACKHRKIIGDTTKYFVCGVKNKAVDDMQCSKCMLRIEDINPFDEMVKVIFGKSFKGGNN